MTGPPAERSPGRTTATILLLGGAVARGGDACHVASGTTSYNWDGVPERWRSAVWFPVLVAGSVLGAARLAERSSRPTARRRRRVDIPAGAGAVLASTRSPPPSGTSP